MELTTQIVDNLAPNADAIKNGKDLIKKGKFSNLSIDAEKTILWGQCAGSGKLPYSCSVDFLLPAAPVSRCTCPSRQFPCKHCVGLMYAYAQGENFSSASLPEDLLAKREKVEKKLEKKAQAQESKAETEAKPKKVNSAALAKKIDAQLTGLELASKMLHNLVAAGLSSLDAKERGNLLDQNKALGNYYISGIQTAFQDLILDLELVRGEEYTQAIDQITYLAALIKRAEEYLRNRRENPAAPLETSSALEEQIGHVWKLPDLVDHGLREENAELAQLSFTVYTDNARREFVDEGVWINLKSGRLHTTKNYRPFKAVKYIREENSTHGVLNLAELYVYPGTGGSRVRWEAAGARERPLEAADYAHILAYAEKDYTQAIKTIKSSIKNPLAEKNPLILLALHRVWQNGAHLVLEDAAGAALTLADPMDQGTTETLLKLFLPAEAQGLTLLARAYNNVQTGLFTARPLSVITPDRIIRLLY